MTENSTPTADRLDWEDALRGFIDSREDETSLPVPPIAVTAAIRRVRPRRVRQHS